MRDFSKSLIVALLAFLATGERAAAAAYLGLKMSDAPAAMGGGALVAAAAPNSPAMIAGLMPNDIVIGIDGQRLANAEQLAEAVAAKNPGQAASLDVLRWDGQSWRRLSLRVTLAGSAFDAPSPPAAGGAAGDSSHGADPSGLLARNPTGLEIPRRRSGNSPDQPFVRHVVSRRRGIDDLQPGGAAGPARVRHRRNAGVSAVPIRAGALLHHGFRGDFAGSAAMPEPEAPAGPAPQRYRSPDRSRPAGTRTEHRGRRDHLMPAYGRDLRWGRGRSTSRRS
jgi:hypothetical protein